MAAVAIVLGALLFQFVVPNGGSTSALVLGILGVLTVPVFWAMVSLPLSAAGLVTAMRARDRGETNGKIKVALILSVLGVVGTFAAIIGDAMSN